MSSAELCKSRSFVGVQNGYVFPPMFGTAKQMFLVVNVAGSGAVAYQMAYAYNMMELRFRKHENGAWGDWVKPQ